MAELNVSLHYPNDPNYDFETKLVRLNLDKEREHDLLIIPHKATASIFSVQIKGKKSSW